MTHKKFKDCLDGIRGGNQKGISLIFDEYFSKTALAVFAKTGEKDVAGSVAKDLITHIFEKAHRIGHIEDPDRFVYRLMCELTDKHVRKNGVGADKAAIGKDAAALSSDPDTLILLTEILDGLTDGERDLVVLSFIYRCADETAAAELGVSVAAVKDMIAGIKKRIDLCKKS